MFGRVDDLQCMAVSVQRTGVSVSVRVINKMMMKNYMFRL